MIRMLLVLWIAAVTVLSRCGFFLFFLADLINYLIYRPVVMINSNFVIQVDNIGVDAIFSL